MRILHAPENIAEQASIRARVQRKLGVESDVKVMYWYSTRMFLITNVLAPPNDPTELANAIQRLLKDKDLRIDVGNKVGMLVERSFSWNAIAKRLCGIYEEMIASEKKI